MKHCTKCDTDKPASEFYRDQSRADGLHSSCKTCSNATRQRTRHRAKTQKPQPHRSASHCFIEVKRFDETTREVIKDFCGKPFTPRGDDDKIDGDDVRMCADHEAAMKKAYARLRGDV